MPNTEAYRVLAVEIERVRAEAQAADRRVTAHEELCAERYSGIYDALTGLKVAQEATRKEIRALSEGAAVSKVVHKYGLKDVQLWVLSGALAALIGISTFTAKELWTLTRHAPEPTSGLTQSK